MSILTFASVGATDSGGGVKKLENGRYRMRVGTFNQFNSSGHYYPMSNKINEILKKDVEPIIVDGKLYGELDHPYYKKGMTAEEYISRVLFVDVKNVAVHISKLEIVETNRKNSLGTEHDVYMEFLPFGVHKQILIDSLADNSINTAFSLRCLFTRQTVNGITYRNIQDIVTYDLVLENGVVKADKFSAGFESKNGVEFTMEEVSHAVAKIEERIANEKDVGIESNINMNALNRLKMVCDTDCLLTY